MGREYLLEVRSLELPPRLAERGMRQLATRLFEDLMGRGLGPAEMLTGMTPRRLTVCLKGLPERQPDREERQLGPPAEEGRDAAGEPSEALLGFAERVGVEPGEVETVKTERGAYLAVVRQLAGRELAAVLREIVPSLLVDLHWGRVGRWGVGERAWPRPVEGVLSLLDGELLELALDGVAAGAETAGHPILSPSRFAVAGFDDYRDKLAERAIEVVPERRREALLAGLRQRAEELGGELEEDPELLDLLVAECEIPGVVHGAFDAGYLELPDDVLRAALKRQQHAFALHRDGDLLPFFLTGMDRPDDPKGVVRAGQERAAAGRLTDARFHYQTDRRVPLAERARRLDQLAFHPRLGSYGDKSARVRALVELACGELGWEAEREPALEAAGLLKADLATDLVRDFPSLRGTVGGLFAREEGYPQAVWRAIYDHYRPGSAEGPVPRQTVGRVVAVADRLDSLVGLFSVAPAPSASKDPFALRRLTQGLLRILLEGEMELDLDLVMARAVRLYDERLGRGAEGLLGELQTFLGERLRRLLGQRGAAFDEIEAAMAVGSRSLPKLAARLAALRTVREEADFRSLVLAAKRISNIVEESDEFELSPELLTEDAEKDLYIALGKVRQRVDRAVEKQRYDTCLRRMLDLVPHLDRFFKDVLVMDENEDLRHNRVALLQSCRRVFWRIARLKEMVVEKGEG